MAELRQRPGDQPLPTPNGHPAIQDLVLTDIEARRTLGIQRYGTALQPFNGRNSLRDAYEEALDLAIYLRQLIYEDENRTAGVDAELAVVEPAETTGPIEPQSDELIAELSLLCVGCFLEVHAGQRETVNPAQIILGGNSSCLSHVQIQQAPVLPGQTPGGLYVPGQNGQVH
jgi:hypothetical protein